MGTLLINPKINPSSQHSVINRVINTAIPTSLGALAGVLIDSQLGPVDIIDEQVDAISEADLENLVLSLRPPRIIGLSVVTINSKRAYEISRFIKKIDPSVLIVFGGIHPTVLCDEVLKHQEVDVVVMGEGERTFRELVRLILNGEEYSSIYGISFRANGKIIRNPSLPMIDKLDDLPSFPYYLFEDNKEKYSTFGCVFTSRGCPYDCIFCSSRSISGRRYRYFSIKRIISEILLLADKYSQQTIWFMDDNITANQKHFVELLDAIIASNLHKRVSFHGSMRGDNISREILEKAKIANFKMISFGLETGKESLMKVINKGETVKDIVEAIKMTDKQGIPVATTIIFGLPTETRKDRWDTIKLVKSLPLSSVRFNTLIPYPGTPAFDLLKEQEKIFIKKDWENFAVQYMWEGDELPYIPDNNDRYELLFDTMFANLSFYLSLNGIKRMLKSSFAGGNVVVFKKKWFLSPRIIYRLFRAFFYLVRRFIRVTYKMLRSRKRI